MIDINLTFTTTIACGQAEKSTNQHGGRNVLVETEWSLTIPRPRGLCLFTPSSLICDTPLRLPVSTNFHPPAVGGDECLCAFVLDVYLW